jgi:hypothetical protein
MSLTHEELQKSIIGLPDFFLTKISKVIAEYKALAAGSEALHFDVCPKCGKEHPHVIKGGKSGFGETDVQVQTLQSKIQHQF